MIDNWVPLFSQMLDSTLWEEEPDVRLTFLTMLILKGPDQVVRMPLRRLAKKVNLCEAVGENEARVGKALEVLKNPDSKSTEMQEYEGRRVTERMENGVLAGWFIINGEHYQRDVMKRLARVRKSEKQRERRALVRNGGKTAQERLEEKAGTAEELARVQEMGDKVPVGYHGSYGPEAQAVVQGRVLRGPQETVEPSKREPSAAVEEGEGEGED